MRFLKVFSLLTALLIPAVSLQAYWVWSPEQGKFVNADGEAQTEAEEKYNYAVKLYKDKNYKQAAEQFQEILKNNPSSHIAPEAQYRLGIIYEETGDYMKAFKTYKRLVESYPQSERFNEVIEREYRMGNLFLAGKKGKLAGFEILPSLPRAAKIFDHIIKSAPYSAYGDKAQFQLGLTYKKMRRYHDAVSAFQAVLDQYPQSKLVSKAQFQLAEASYLRSSAEFRDQRALEEASRNVDKYLTRHPDSAASEQAAKLRQAIDEKNAEKNYRIGAYYEKENYLDSALIYYGDVAARYSHTMWGARAAEKLKALKEPATFITSQEKEVAQEIQILEAKIKAAPKEDKLEREQLERKLERAKKRGKSVEKNKKESLERRNDDIARRTRELKEKFKNLEQKKKLMKNNPSEDLKRAIDRWHASLVAEQESLESEGAELKALKEDLGVRDKKFGLDFIPFMGEEPTELERVRQIEAKKFYKLSQDKKSLLEDKEFLYKQHGEVATLLKQTQANQFLLPATGAEAKEIEEARAKLDSLRQKIKTLEDQLDQKSAAYEKQYGNKLMHWVKAPAKIVNESKDTVAKSLDRSLNFLNPFGNDAAQGGPQALLERRMHLKEKLAAQQNLVQTLSEAFDAQLAVQEKRRVLSQINTKEKVDIHALRKETKSLERDIRSAYEEIEDRHKESNKMLRELDTLLKGRVQKKGQAVQAAAAVASPVVKTGRLVKAFFVGLPHEEVELTKSAAKVPQDGPDAVRISQLREQIDMESRIIDAKHKEIVQKQRELEVLKAKASLAGGFKFRRSFVQVPYVFVGEAIESARRVIPKKDREEILINRLNEETKKLEALKAELAELEKQISVVGADLRVRPSEGQTHRSAPTVKPASASAKDQTALRSEIDALAGKLEVQKNLFEQESRLFEKRMEAYQEKTKGSKKSQKKFTKGQQKRLEKLQKELREIEGELTKLIEKESELESEESMILEKRITEIDKSMKKIRSKALSQDLLTERERMEQRFSELQSRRDFLSKELQRFQVAKAGNPRT